MTGQPSLLVPTELTHSALPADVGARVVVGLVPLLMQSSQQATFPPLNISQALWVSLVLFPSISPLKDQATQKSLWKSPTAGTDMHQAWTGHHLCQS